MSLTKTGECLFSQRANKKTVEDPYMEDQVITRRKDTLTARKTQRSLGYLSSVLVPNVGDRNFSACAPRLWNNFPSHLRTLPELELKTQFKTHLFGVCYGEVVP